MPRKAGQTGYRKKLLGLSAAYNCPFFIVLFFPSPQIQNRAVVNEDVSQSAVEMAAELQRLRREVAMLRGLANSSSGGSDGSTELRQALVVNEQLEDSNKHLQQQLGRLRQ